MLFIIKFVHKKWIFFEEKKMKGFQKNALPLQRALERR